MYKSCLIILITMVFCSCTSFSDNVKANKEKFIQIGIENSHPVDLNNLEAVYTTAQANNTEAKIKYLKIDTLKTLYQDSLVLFNHADEMAIYDFSENERDILFIKANLKLSAIEQVDTRLFIGKRK